MSDRASTDHANQGSYIEDTAQRKYKGVRRRKWGKWVSEIRVPGTQDRLWLGSFASPEAAAVAHDIASYCLRGPSSMQTLNFPDQLVLPASVREDMSPKSIQKAASDAGMAIDAQMIQNRSVNDATDEVNIQSGGSMNLQTETWASETTEDDRLSISIDDYL